MKSVSQQESFLKTLSMLLTGVLLLGAGSEAFFMSFYPSEPSLFSSDTPIFCSFLPLITLRYEKIFLLASGKYFRVLSAIHFLSLAGVGYFVREYPESFPVFSTFTVWLFLSGIFLKRGRIAFVFFGLCLAGLLLLESEGFLSGQGFICYVVVWLLGLAIFYFKGLSVNRNDRIADKTLISINKGNQIILAFEKEKVVYASDSLSVILGYEKVRFIGKTWPEITEKYSLLISREQGSGEIHRMKTREGRDLLIEWYDTPNGDDFRVRTGRDISSLKKTESDLSRTNSRLETLLTRSGDFIFVVNEEQILTAYYSDSKETPFASSGELTGRSIADTGLPEEVMITLIPSLQYVLSTGNSASMEYLLPAGSGKKWYLFEISLSKEGMRGSPEVVCVARNITARKNAETELKHTKELLEQTSHVARVGGWELNMKTGETEWSDMIREIFEVDSAFKPDLANIPKFCYDEQNWNKLDQMIEDCVLKRTREEAYIRILTAAGKDRWVRLIGQAEFENDVCKRLYGTVHDVDNEIRLNQKVWESELQYRTLISNISGVAFRCRNDEHWSMIFISDAIERMTGYPAEDFIHNNVRSFASIIHPDDQTFLLATFAAGLKVGEEYELEYRLTSREGKMVWISETGRGYFDEDGSLLYLDGIMTDITDRKKSQDELLEAQTQLYYKSELMLANARITEQLLINPDITLALKDTMCLSGLALKADRAYYFEYDPLTQLFNQKVEWVKDGISSEFDNPDLQDVSLNKLLKEPFDLYKPFSCIRSELPESPFRNLLASQGILSVLLLPVFVQEAFLGFIGFDDCAIERRWSEDEVSILQSLASNIANAIDRTAREKAIKQSEANFREINDAIEDVFWLFDVNRRRSVFVSPSCKQVLGIDVSYFYERNHYIYDYVLKEDREMVIRSFKGLLKNNSYDIAYRMLDPDGNIRWIHEKAYAIRDEEGTLVRISGICSDITEHKLIENEIRQLSVVARQTRNGVVITDRNGFAIWANDAFLDMFEITLPELMRQRPRELFHLNQEGFSEKLDEDLFDTNFSREIEFVTFKGNRLWIDISNTVIQDENGEVEQHIKVLTDITHRKKSEDELKESQRNLTLILNAMDEVVWAISLPERKPLFISPSYYTLTGIPPEKWIEDFTIWNSRIHPEDISVPDEVRREHEEAGYSDKTLRVLDQHDEVRWVHSKSKVVRNENDVPFMLMGIIVDITHKKDAEREVLLAREQADKANRSKAELELRTLQLQMNPHFIFNALNSIQSFVMHNEAITANNYLTKFAHLIRLFLDSSRSKFISLNEEIRLLTFYMELEKLRFEHKFDFEIYVSAEVNRFIEIPTMILQPFVENAINHGLRYKAGKGKLNISFYLRSDFLICMIEDNGVGRKNASRIQAKSKNGYRSQGLKITSERLATYSRINGTNILFTISDKISDPEGADDEVGTVIEIKFPQI